MKARLPAFRYKQRGSGRGRQSGTGRRTVVMHLGFEVLDRGERCLGAQALDEGAAQAPAVQIDLVLEQMDFEQPVAAPEGRTHPEARAPALG